MYSKSVNTVPRLLLSWENIPPAGVASTYFLYAELVMKKRSIKALRIHRVIMYFIKTKTTSRLHYSGHLPLNTYVSVVCIAAVATELGGIKVCSFLQICLKSKK
jgi:hypothetical protein